MHHPLPQLRRVRWAVRATLILGVAASVAANVLHARSDPVAQIIAAWPPLALLLTVELISRVPVDRRGLAAARLVATTAIAAIAAWVSYRHMASVAARYGETGASPYLLPLSVDGLVVVASISLVELAGRLRTTQAGIRGAAIPPAPVPAAVSVAGPQTAVEPARAAGVPEPAEPAPNPAQADDVPTRVTVRAAASRPALPKQLRPSSAPVTARHANPVGGPGPAPQPPVHTVDAVASCRAYDPQMSVRDICEKVGRSERTVRRILNRLPTTTGPPTTGHGVNNAAVAEPADAVTSH